MAEPGSTKDTLLSGAEREFAELKRTIAGLTEAQMRERWCGTWGVHEILAHVSGWHRELIPALERMSRGERPIAEGVSYQDADPWNTKFAAAKQSSSTAEVLAELDASHADFLQAARAVDADRYVPDKTAYKIVDLNSRHHYQEHAQEIAVWRQSRGI
jgi:hypothetical protein